MIKKAKQLMSKWEDEGMNGFFMDFFAAQTGFEIDSQEYAEVYELVIEGKI